MRSSLAALTLMFAANAEAHATAIEPLMLLEGARIAACGVRIAPDAGRHPIAAAEMRISRAGDTTLFTFSLTATAGMSVALSGVTLTTASYSTVELFPPPQPASSGRLETRTQLDAFTGADLMRELLVSGGRITAMSADGAAHDLPVDPPIPHGVRQAYLNCAGDLVRPGSAGENVRAP